MINFGTGGWRAIIGKDFVYDNITRVAMGVVSLARKEGKTDKPIVVGYDRRFLSQNEEKWVSEVIAGGGIDVWLMPRSTPTPLVMHTVKDSELYYGIEITASPSP